MVLSQDKVRLLFTLQLVKPSEGFFFCTFPKIKKVRSWLCTRVRGCPPVSPHPRRLLSWRSRPCRTPSSGASLGRQRWQVLLLEQTHWSVCLEGSSWCRGRLGRIPGQGGSPLLLAQRFSCQYVSPPSSSFWVRGATASPGRYTNTGRRSWQSLVLFAFCLKSAVRGSGRSLPDTSYSALLGDSGYKCASRLGGSGRI